MSLNIIAMVQASTKGGKRVESECIKHDEEADANATEATLPDVRHFE